MTMTKKILYLKYIFVDTQDESYLKSTSPKRMVIDFIAGMTDMFFLHQIEIN